MVTYRFAVPSDAAQILKYTKIIGSESDFLSYGAEGLPVTLEQETRFLHSIQADPYNRFFLALDGEQLIGCSNLSGSNRPRFSHRRELGISVLRDYWGKGVGTGLMEQMIQYAKGTGVELITLSVRADNLRAKSLYRRFGFVLCGTWPSYIKVGSRSFDVDMMAMRVRP
ncbi:MAG: GNAT family N-acetyltransferase [Oscillospiraceae bacterium]|nr:GNAT family N-acetyltransferase [Oscillospiraceae bacterium]